MNDLVSRLRTWTHSVHAAPASDIMDEAAAEIERLRNGAVGSRETVQLTDEEREAVESAAAAFEYDDDNLECGTIAATLRALLERTGGCTPESDSGADRKSVASTLCRDTGVQPFDSAPITLTDAEREAIEYFARDNWALSPVLRGLLERTLPPEPYAKTDEKAPFVHTVRDWMTRPYWVDPPSGHRYGFPKMYDPAKDGPMVEWMIANGYPESLTRKGLSCTFSEPDE